jgi:hypothetical protein
LDKDGDCIISNNGFSLIIKKNIEKSYDFNYTTPNGDSFLIPSVPLNVNELAISLS